MSHVAGSYMWDLNLAPADWATPALNITAGRGLAVNGGPRLYAVEWEDDLSSSDVQVGRAGPVVAVVVGAARVRPDLPHCNDIAATVARELAAGRSVEAALAALDGEFLTKEKV